MPQNDGDDWDMPSPSKLVLSQNLQKLLDEAKEASSKTSQNQFAKAAGLDQKNLSRWLNAEVEVRLDMLDQIAKGVKRQAWELLLPGMQLPTDLSERAYTIARQFDALGEGSPAQDQAWAIIRLVLQGHRPPGGTTVDAEPAPGAPHPAPTKKRVRAR